MDTDKELLREELLRESYKQLWDEYDREYRGHKDDRVLDTNETRFFLHWALQNAQEKLLISCPWIVAQDTHPYFFLNMNTDNLPVMDGYKIKEGLTIEEEMKLLKEREVQIRVIFGFTGYNENEKRNDLALNNRKILYDVFGGSDNPRFEYRHNNHQKVLLMDNELMIVGSYNFLSFPGTNDVGNRKEKAYLTHDRGLIEKMWKEI